MMSIQQGIASSWWSSALIASSCQKRRALSTGTTALSRAVSPFVHDAEGVCTFTIQEVGA
jgi:hypothetical protein